MSIFTTRFNIGRFSSGFELSTFVTSSGLLKKSWNAIMSSSGHVVTGGVGLSWKVHKETDSDFTILSFEATPVSNLQLDLVPSSALREKGFNHFEFLRTKKSPVFSVNSAAVELFLENHQMLDQLKSQITRSTLLIVTGKGFGGSIAILFTLSLLDSIGTGKNHLLCITFGSPLIGDKKLQQAISRSSTWNSCFLQVVSNNDPLPMLLTKNHASDYMPFGTFLFCSVENSTCFENPDSILEILKVMAPIQDQNQEFQPEHYGSIVENLYRRAIFKDLTGCDANLTGYSSLQACISLQLSALGLTPQMQQQQQQKNNDLVTIMEKQEMMFTFLKRTSFDPAKKLNVVKIDMVQLEWYKKDSKKKNTGYYDCYKKMNSTIDLDVVKFHKNLTNYWIKMVEEAEMKPQKEGASFRTRWLYAGTNYRRMVEPLDIAEYYREGGKNYVTEKRSRHYKVLEEWLSEGKTASSGSNSTRNVESILTSDSCFWAHVEEALLSCKQFKDVTQKEEAKKKLLGFQVYVYELLKNYEVSSEIFLKGSSYMIWWNDYKKIDGAPYYPELEIFMSNAHNYDVHYVKGTYNFS